MCALHGVVRSISGVDIHVIKLGPCLQRSSSLATRDKQQQQAKHEPVSQPHWSKLTAPLRSH